MKTIRRLNLMGTALLRLQLKKTPFVSARLFSSSAALTDYEQSPASSAGESAVYRHALKSQRPTTVRFQEDLRNFVSLIGPITEPLRACNTDKLGLYTYLQVQGDNRGSEIQLKFWDHMAEVAVQHLKLHDLVYVSGRLESYLKLNEDESSVLHYLVNVKEMNFVAQNNVPESCQYIVKTKGSYEENLQNHRNQLHLWQVFFANPSEWWDNRNNKLKLGSPDFRHKDTREALWISKNDPPWINEQLQLYDSRLSQRSDVREESSHEETMQKRRNRLHLWQIFFANPLEWWDNRNNKLTPRCPDFKHKDTDEALWIKENDPPWINEQLQLLDSRLSKRSDVHQKRAWSHLSPLVFD